MKQNIAIFLSGTGSNARAICTYFQNHPYINVGLLLSNKVNSGAKAIGETYNIPYLIFNKDEFCNSELLLPKLNQHHITTIVLAGFLWLIPEYLLEAFPDRIINIHPALLPKYGGKGMHGIHVHEAVCKNKEKESGITIHLCNKEYDKGEILFQKRVPLSESETPDSIARAVLNLEHQFFPKVIEAFLLHGNVKL
ncbi:MAG TPA: phosphoribosylglycinamide formyltransferase [Chitinophagales bacterium]|nr:phosphoribosylglycinamide formyltransferase [Chitinophagales bacterium]HNM33017.1 phosphoribosylglycinamide formyltransferase [Chitinophagales bacterium]